MRDSALEREIEAALAVDPSPEFVARVRTRIASEQPPAPWWQLRWTVLATGAAVAALVVVALSWRPPIPGQVTAHRDADVVLSSPSRTEPVSAQASAAAAPAPRIRVAADRGAHASSRAPEPEVLVSRDEQRAFELLLAAVWDGRIPRTLPSELAARDAAEEGDIALMDIVVQPLQQIAGLAGLEGEGQ